MKGLNQLLAEETDPKVFASYRAAIRRRHITQRKRLQRRIDELEKPKESR